MVFPEEGTDPNEGKILHARLDSIRLELSSLPETADQGRILREGVRVVIYGATNAGKSSLLNRLLGYEDRKSTRLNSSHSQISYAVFCLKKKIILIICFN